MVKIEDIELLIRQLITTNEKLVTNYDSELLCSDFENTKTTLKELNDKKQETIKSLEKSMNDFFKIRQNIISRTFKVASFRLIPNPLNFKYLFSLPKTVDTSSRQYFCYTHMMDRLSREYDVITHQKEGYYILDITATLNLNKLLR